MFWGKIFYSKDDIVVAICDEKLLDKKIKYGDVKINVSKYFYGGQLIDKEYAIKLMEKSTVGNLIGEEIVGIAMENGFIVKENIISINGIPHAQFVKI